jgi:hypothetical protein
MPPGRSKLCPESANPAARDMGKLCLYHVYRIIFDDARGESLWHDYGGLIRESRACLAGC